jgi:hypothetical protein
MVTLQTCAYPTSENRIIVRADRGEVPGLELEALVHDEVVCVVPEEHVDRAATWLEGLMESVADAVVTGEASPEERVPLKADAGVCGSWGDK